MLLSLARQLLQHPYQVSSLKAPLNIFQFPLYPKENQFHDLCPREYIPQPLYILKHMSQDDPESFLFLEKSDFQSEERFAFQDTESGIFLIQQDQAVEC